ncbi:hypothetical protein TWF281_004413 [Arthrobotrys megalospora]
MREHLILQTSLLLATWLLPVPCQAFYRLWGYTDIRKNLADNKLLKAQSSLLTRGSRIDQKPLCHSFPDPTGTELGIIRVVGLMSHPDLGNPIQAMGLWEERDFNCGNVPPRLIIYLQPGQEAQIIDLRQFGGEWVYSNWKQIMPGDRYWDEFIAPELRNGRDLGNGFVKKLIRKADDHKVVENTDILWDTQVPDKAWIIDKRAALLRRDASKSGFESRFKMELEALLEEEEKDPLGEAQVEELTAQLKSMKQALDEQYGKWQMARVETQIRGVPEQKGGVQLGKDTDPLLYTMNPYRVWEGSSERQGRWENEGVRVFIEGGDEVEHQADLGIAEPGYRPPNQNVDTAIKEEPVASDIGPGMNTNRADLTMEDPFFSSIPYRGTFDRASQMDFSRASTNPNPYVSTNNFFLEPIRYSNPGQPWRDPFDEMIARQQQNTLLSHKFFEHQALERVVAEQGLLRIKHRPQPPIISKPFRWSDPNAVPVIPPFRADETPSLNMKRVLPSADEVLDSLEAEKIRKGLFLNQNPQRPIWRNIDTQLQGEVEGLQRPMGGNRDLQIQNFLRNFAEQRKQGGSNNSQRPPGMK